MNFLVFSQNNRGRRGSDEILRQSLARCEAEREITGRAYLTLKNENIDLLRENRELKDKIRVLEGKQRDLEAKNRELDGKYQLCLSKVEGMAGQRGIEFLRWLGCTGKSMILEAGFREIR